MNILTSSSDFSSSSDTSIFQRQDTIHPPQGLSGHTLSYFEDYIYVFGGILPDQTMNTHFYRYSVPMKQWSILDCSGKVPLPRSSHSAVVDPYRRKLYILCGSGIWFGYMNYNDIYEYHFDYQHWSEIKYVGDDINAVYGQSAVLYNHSIYIFGGTFGTTFTDAFYRLELNTNRVYKIRHSSFRNADRYKHSAFIYHDKMYIYAGVSHSLDALDDMNEYDFIQNRWTPIDCMGERPVGRFSHASCVIDHSFYIFGGSNYSCVFDDCHLLDLRRWKWQRLPSFPVCRYFHTAVYATSDHRIYIFGGKLNTHESRSNELWSCSLPEFKRDILKEDMKRFFESKTLFEALSDVCFLSTDGDVYYSHSIILKSRCPDISFDVYETLNSKSLHLFLYYIYTDEVYEVEPYEVLTLFQLVSTSIFIRRCILWIELDWRRRMTNERANVFYSSHLDMFTKEFVSYLKIYIFLRRSSSKMIQIHHQPSLSFISSYTRDFSRILWNEPCDRRIDQVKCHSVVLAIRTKLFSCDTFLYQYMNTDMTCDFLTLPALRAFVDYLYQGKDCLFFVKKCIRKEWKRKDIVHYFGLTSDEVYIQE